MSNCASISKYEKRFRNGQMEDKWKKNMDVIQHFMPALGTRQFLIFSGTDALQDCQNCRFENLWCYL